MTASNRIKKKPVYAPIECRCGVVFSPITSRQKHCSPSCRFKAIAEPFVQIDGCWEWPKGYFSQTGYGQFAIDASTPETAHRMSYQVFNGKVGDGLYVCHICDNRKCFNPKHLFLGTPQINVDDMIVKGRAQDYKASAIKRTGLLRPYKSKKFSKVDLDEIARLHKCGASARSIARQFGCDHKTITNITTSGSKDKTDILANSQPVK